MAAANSVLDSLTAGNIFDLKGVVAVVTGGGTGIGLMISTTLMANGATVYIVGPEQTRLDGVAKAYNDASQGREGRGRLIGLEGDVSKKEEAKRLAEEIGKHESYVTVLFNNAGIHEGGLSPPPAELSSNTSASTSSTSVSAATYLERYWAITPEAFDNSLRTNAYASYWMSAAFLPLLEKWKESPGGKKFAPQIIITSSMNGWTKDIATSGSSFPYTMSKSAVGHFTSAFAHDLLPLGIRVNGIAPGFFITEMTSPGSVDNLGISHLPPSRTIGFDIPTRQASGSGFPTVGGTNRDMGSLALFLVANWFVNGETVLIDGGTLLRHPSSY